MKKAIEAVRQWKFKPGYRDGSPVPVTANIEVNFRLLDNPVSPGVEAGVAEGVGGGVFTAWAAASRLRSWFSPPG